MSNGLAFQPFSELFLTSRLTMEWHSSLFPIYFFNFAIAMDRLSRRFLIYFHFAFAFDWHSR